MACTACRKYRYVASYALSKWRIFFKLHYYKFKFIAIFAKRFALAARDAAPLDRILLW